MVKERILIFYDHFYPAYKAGGPVQSIVNLIRLLHTQYEFYVVCKPHEMNEKKKFGSIAVDQWNNWEDKARVYYWDYKGSEKNRILKILNEINPSVVFINGLYSLYFNILPLFYSVQRWKKTHHVKVILSARGMLHPGALSQKTFKKKIFITLLRLLQINKQISWHATDENEVSYIKREFGNASTIETAGNIPNLQIPLPVLAKQEGELILGTIALISPMKNHLEVMNALLSLQQKIQWNIYGPVKDKTYWQTCLQVMKQLPPNITVSVKGEMNPAELSKALATFHVFIMPSKSENFGHAILEALSAGKPVITTTTTPYKNLGEHKAGITVDINALPVALSEAFSRFALMKQEEYTVYCNDATSYAQSLVSTERLQKEYRQLFNN